MTRGIPMDYVLVFDKTSGKIDLKSGRVVKSYGYWHGAVLYTEMMKKKGVVVTRVHTIKLDRDEMKGAKE